MTTNYCDKHKAHFMRSCSVCSAERYEALERKIKRAIQDFDLIHKLAWEIQMKKPDRGQLGSIYLSAQQASVYLKGE